MKLTGKAKEDFEKWYIKSYDSVMTITAFYNLPFAMQWGVYVDFFDSKGIEIMLDKDFRDCWVFVIDATEYGNFSTRAEARKEAIETANEIYNK